MSANTRKLFYGISATLIFTGAVPVAKAATPLTQA